MKLAVLAARVGAGGERVEQSPVEAPASERGRQSAEIDSGKMCFQAGIDHFAREGLSRPAPYRKNRRNAGSRKVPLSVCPHVLEEQIAENHAGHAGRSGVADRLR